MSVHTFKHEAMATWFEARVAGEDETYAKQAAQEAFSRLDRLESLLSRYREESEITQIRMLAEGEALQLSRVRFTIQEKFATAFSVLSFAIVAIPLGIKVSRKETSANLGIGLLLALSYYFASIVPGMFDKYPALRPDLLVWLPNIAFQGLGLWLFYKIDRA